MKRTMNRRQFIKVAGASAAGLTAGGCGAVGAKTAGRKRDKPNLLFIWTDEQRADTMATYGNNRIHAPNLNKLAAESVVFSNAYVTQPVCTPNRSAVMTGLWPHTTGCIKNNVPLPADVPCLPELLDDPEYRTAYMGKWHLGDEIFAQHGFEEWVSMEDGYGSGYSAGRDRSARSDYHHFLIEHGYQPDGGGKFSRGFAARRPIEHCKPKFLELKACDFLRRHRSEPFVLTINFLEPHMPFFGPLDDEHDPNRILLPANFTDPLEENEPLRYRIAREYCRAKYGQSEREIWELIARYWGLVTQVDRSVGAILRTLEELGLAENTIVVYTSDHGDMMGSHHMVEKSVMYQEAVRIPWLMRIPRVKGRRIEQPVSQIDMVPTLLELLGPGRGADLPGRSLVPLMQGASPARDHVFIQWNPNSGALKLKKGGTNLASRDELKRIENEHSRAVISPDGWKLCLSDVDKSQLFNLRDDPGETTNLFDSGRHADVIARLSAKIRAWQESVQDKVKL
ncbi:MAG: sulfatase-like hydrolase/transferase [Phycisphaerales bacterium]|nr:MAG: sulfatase-like hydrolase/transferase [Phycisphaerales bacterium]